MQANALVGIEPDGRRVAVVDPLDAIYSPRPQLALFAEPEEPFRRCPVCGRWHREVFPRVVGRDASGRLLIRWEPRSVCTLHRVDKDNVCAQNVVAVDVEDDGCLDEIDGEPVDDLADG